MIREANLSEMDAVVSIWHACELTRPWNDPESDFKSALVGPSSTVLVKMHGDQIVGTVMVGVDGHRGWIYYLSVRPELRGVGIGTELVSSAESWIKEHGIPKAMLMVRSTNQQVLAFYEKLGYKVEEISTLGKRFQI